MGRLMNLNVGFAAAIAMMLLVAPATNALAVVYVDTAAGGANDGTSWSDAYNDLQTALASSTVGDQIWVAAGTYYPTSTTTRNIRFDLVEGVELYGGFNGTETLLSQRNVAQNVTTLSGEIGTASDPTDNSFIVVKAVSTTAATVLDGFTVSGGYDPVSGVGAGMYINNGVVTISNCRFTENAAFIGGGLYNFRSSPIITSCTFDDNDAERGGGIFNDNESSPIISFTMITNNRASQSGGGLFNHLNSSPTLTSVTIDANVASPQHLGGGIFTRLGSEPTYDNVSVTNNSGSGIHTSDRTTPVTGVFIDGNSHRGIYAMGSTEVRDIIVSNNTSGGARSGTATTYINVAFIENDGSGGAGAGIQTYGDDTIINCLFAGNNAARGGAISAQGGNVLIVNSTFWGNSVDYTDPCLSFNVSTVTIANSIFWGNFSTVNYNCQHPICGSGVAVNNSIVQYSGGTSGWTVGWVTDAGFNLDTDPLFVDAAGSNFELQNSSPAINAGASGYSSEPFDLLGNPRVQGGAVDMGAIESSIVVSVENDTPHIGAPTIQSAYPNPFNPSVTIKFVLLNAQNITMVVHDARGRFVAELARDRYVAGAHQVVWTGTSFSGDRVASGVYFVSIATESGDDVRKLVLVK